MELFWYVWKEKGNKFEVNCGDRIFNKLDI